MLNKVLIVFFILLISACSKPIKLQARDAAPTVAVDIASIQNANPKLEPRTRYGNPPSYEVFGKRYHVMQDSKDYSERGIASWYGTKFHEKLTSSREPYNMYAMTAAHKSLPLPTYVKVTNLETDKTIVVKVNDRGPFHDNRIIDLSFVAAKKLGLIAKGTGLVEVTAIDPTHPELAESKVPTLHKKHHPEMYLQVGAFNRMANAERISEKLKKLTTEKVQIKDGKFNEQIIYKVQIGPLPNVEQTDNISQRIKTAGLGTPITVIE